MPSDKEGMSEQERMEIIEHDRENAQLNQRTLKLLKESEAMKERGRVIDEAMYFHKMKELAYQLPEKLLSYEEIFELYRQIFGEKLGFEEKEEIGELYFLVKDLKMAPRISFQEIRSRL